jgi:imidazole glycerol phosphate synthase subunit HisF
VHQLRPTRKEVEGRKKPVVAMGGLTKCEHFAQAVRGGKGGIEEEKRVGRR